MCTTIPVIEKTLEEIGSELRQWVDGEENNKLDKWFKNYANYFI
ncbi:MAG: hypothetical protein SOR73_09195 [Romboutsia timonensis]|nr:hypothetical protein [Romboutsia timonensis]